MSAFLIDTDIWTLACQNHPPTRARIVAVTAPDRLMVSAITVEEAVTGWLTYIRRAASPDRLELGYDKLLDVIRSLDSFELV